MRNTLPPLASNDLLDGGAQKTILTAPEFVDDSTSLIFFLATMGRGDECPLVPARRRQDWKIPDPRNMSDHEFRAVRDLIEAHVIALLRDLRVTGHLRSI